MPPPYPPTIPADIKHKFNDFDNHYDKLKARVEFLESEARRLTAREEELARKEKDIQQKEDALILRIKATDNNATARLANSRLTSPHDILFPLHELASNKPIKGFPRHERDIRIMAPGEVVNVLKALDVEVSGGAAERKMRLRMVLGMERQGLSPQGEGKEGRDGVKKV